MRAHDFDTAITRRGALLGGGAAVGGLVAAGPLAAGAAARTPAARKQSGKLPSKEIEKILELEGTVSDGVLSIDVSRDDIGKVRGPLGVEFDGSFEIDGTLTFQPLGGDLAFFNGDLPLKPRETQPFIDAIIANRLVWQAFHQHYIEMSPNVWFIHWRGVGAPLTLARAVRNVLRVTATKLPQKMPANPKSPLDAKRLETILRGSAQIGNEGVVTVNVLRSDRIVIDGVRVSPEANISTNIEFKPLGGSTAWAGPDFAMTGTEVMKVVPLMRRLGWFSGCLYNQETSEAPQLYFDHMLKRGDAYSLAAEIRQGLDLTRAH
ncbi:MAG: DUF1259 domain-containing protein [Solirubrobacteraceae bacterium]